jgi:hypothetical protein
VVLLIKSNAQNKERLLRQWRAFDLKKMQFRFEIKINVGKNNKEDESCSFARSFRTLINKQSTEI